MRRSPAAPASWTTPTVRLLLETKPVQGLQQMTEHSLWRFSRALHRAINERQFAEIEPLIDEDLITLGVRWRFLQAKGDTFENEKMEYMLRLESLQGADGGRDAIRFGERRDRVFMPNNIPDSNFG